MAVAAPTTICDSIQRFNNSSVFDPTLNELQHMHMTPPCSLCADRKRSTKRSEYILNPQDYKNMVVKDFLDQLKLYSPEAAALCVMNRLGVNGVGFCTDVTLAGTPSNPYRYKIPIITDLCIGLKLVYPETTSYVDVCIGQFTHRISLRGQQHVSFYTGGFLKAAVNSVVTKENEDGLVPSSFSEIDGIPLIMCSDVCLQSDGEIHIIPEYMHLSTALRKKIFTAPIYFALDTDTKFKCERGVTIEKLRLT